MNHLNKALNQFFKPAAPRQPHRKAREVAKALAAKHGITVEREDSTLVVWPPRDLVGADPWEGDHGCQNWSEVLIMVKAYAEARGSVAGH